MAMSTLKTFLGGAAAPISFLSMYQHHLAAAVCHFFQFGFFVWFDWFALFPPPTFP
jgi:hypothetical protein